MFFAKYVTKQAVLLHNHLRYFCLQSLVMINEKRHFITTRNIYNCSIQEHATVIQLFYIYSRMLKHYYVVYYVLTRYVRPLILYQKYEPKMFLSHC